MSSFSAATTTLKQQEQWQQSPVAVVVRASGFRIPYVLKPTDGMGMGLFAAISVPKGTCLWTYIPGVNVRTLRGEGALRQHLEALENADTQRSFLEHIFITDKDCINEILDDGRFWNHSERPNTETAVDGSAYAKRDIEAGEELLDDYGTYCYPDWYSSVIMDYNVVEDYFVIKQLPSLPSSTSSSETREPIIVTTSTSDVESTLALAATRPAAATSSSVPSPPVQKFPAHLEGLCIALRSPPAVDTDAEVAALLSDPIAMRYLPFMTKIETGGWTAEDCISRREWQIQQQQQLNAGWFCTIHDRDKEGVSEFHGIGGLRSVDWSHRAAEAGIILKPSSWGKGLCADMHLALLTFSFETLKLHRITFVTSKYNVAMKNFCENVLFAKLEGICRDMFSNGYNNVQNAEKRQYEDTAMYSLLDSEWEAAKLKLMEKLSHVALIGGKEGEKKK